MYINEVNTSPRNVPLFCCRIVNPILTRSGPRLTRFFPSLQRHNSPADSVRELLKSSTDSASLLVSIKKYICFGLGVLLWGRHKVRFYLIFDRFIWSWPQSNEPYFGSIFLKT